MKAKLILCLLCIFVGGSSAVAQRGAVVLAAELSALAGPAAGPSGAQVFVDGFTAGPSLPDKQSIREIVINQNPFSAEWERIGFGNIQILTRPGTGQFHGNGAFTFSDAALNSRNPYASNRPAYQRRIYDAGINGPLSKRSSFFLAFSRREIDDTAVVNATALNSSLQPVQLSEAIVTPRRLMSVSPRFDLQLNKANTLSARYHYNSGDLENQGVGGFSLASRGFSYKDQLSLRREYRLHGRRGREVTARQRLSCAAAPAFFTT